MWILKDYTSTGGGTNNTIQHKVIDGFCVLKTFTGKTAEKRANSFIRKSSKQ